MDMESRLGQLLIEKGNLEQFLRNVNDEIQEEARLQFCCFVARLWYRGIRYKGTRKYIRVEDIAEYLTDTCREQLRLIAGGDNYTDRVIVGIASSKVSGTPFKYEGTLVRIVKTITNGAPAIHIENFKV